MNAPLRIRTLPLAELDPAADRAVFRRAFDGRPGIAFSAWDEATTFLRTRGFSVGRSSDDKPAGVMFGIHDIPAWRDMTRQEQAALHGTITGCRRYGPLRIAIFREAPAKAIVAVATREIDGAKR